MRRAIKKVVTAVVAALVLAIPGLAQNVEPPFTWEGPGDGVAHQRGRD